jgi:acylphosphatase
MSRKRVHAVVHGRVQGVFFRDYTRRKARELGVAGWVRNLPQGTVETVVEGEPDKVAAMVDWLHEGSPLSAVSSVDVSEEDPGGEEDFVIRY